MKVTTEMIERGVRSGIKSKLFKGGEQPIEVYEKVWEGVKNILETALHEN